jgi:hypothetical protein
MNMPPTLEARTADRAIASLRKAIEELAAERPREARAMVVNAAGMHQAWAAVRSFQPDVALVHLFAYHLSPAVLWPLRSVPTVFKEPSSRREDFVALSILAHHGSKRRSSNLREGTPGQLGAVHTWHFSAISRPEPLRPVVRGFSLAPVDVNMTAAEAD